MVVFGSDTAELAKVRSGSDRRPARPGRGPLCTPCWWRCRLNRLTAPLDRVIRRAGAPLTNTPCPGIADAHRNVDGNGTGRRPLADLSRYSPANQRRGRPQPTTGTARSRYSTSTDRRCCVSATRHPMTTPWTGLRRSPPTTRRAATATHVLANAVPAWFTPSADITVRPRPAQSLMPTTTGSRAYRSHPHWRVSHLRANSHQGARSHAALPVPQTTDNDPSSSPTPLLCSDDRRLAPLAKFYSSDESPPAPPYPASPRVHTPNRPQTATPQLGGALPPITWPRSPPSPRRHPVETSLAGAVGSLPDVTLNGQSTLLTVLVIVLPG